MAQVWMRDVECDSGCMEWWNHYMHKWNERKAHAWACVCVCVCVCGRGRAHESCEMLSVLKVLDVHINSQFVATLMHLGNEHSLGTTKWLPQEHEITGNSGII